MFIFLISNVDASRDFDKLIEAINCTNLHIYNEMVQNRAFESFHYKYVNPTNITLFELAEIYST